MCLKELKLRETLQLAWGLARGVVSQYLCSIHILSRNRFNSRWYFQTHSKCTFNPTRSTVLASVQIIIVIICVCTLFYNIVCIHLIRAPAWLCALSMFESNVQIFMLVVAGTLGGLAEDAVSYNHHAGPYER